MEHREAGRVARESGARVNDARARTPSIHRRVMAPAQTGDAAVRLWDAIEVIAQEAGFFEITRPRINPPRPPELDSTPRD